MKNLSYALLIAMLAITFALCVNKAEAKFIVDGAYHITVAAGTIEQQVAACKYRSVDRINSKNFKADPPHKAEVLLGRFDDWRTNSTSGAILRAMDKHGLRPATMSEVLTLVAQYPKIHEEYKQRKERIIDIHILGSVLKAKHGRDHRYFGVVHFDGGPPWLSLPLNTPNAGYNGGQYWTEPYQNRYAVVRK